MPSTTPSNIVFSLGILMVLLSGADHGDSRAQTPVSTSRVSQEREGYLGDSSCAPCHKVEAATYARTAHHLTSQLPAGSTILGSFLTGSNVLQITRPAEGSGEAQLSFAMQHKEDGYYQTANAELGDRHLAHGERIDLVFGSGTRGQTYLSWRGNDLSELPVSYWTDGQQWINSPGYVDGTANFSRHANARCLECHTTYIKAMSSLPNGYSYDRSTLSVGISCETCHGAGAAHVAAQSAQPRVSPPLLDNTVLNPARFSRDRQVDACALCHNGTQGLELQPAFSFKPGDILGSFIRPDATTGNDDLDVHGNQAGLLKRSRCYLNSPSMTCTTCHDIHAPERSAASYSPRCLQCHTWQSCGASVTLGRAIVSNCVDCHMPLQQTAAIVSVTAGKVMRTSIRTHLIKIYPAIAPGTSPHR